MRPTWLIESGVYRSEADAFLAEIRRQGMIGELVPYAALKQGNTPIVGGRPLGEGACAIGYGTFPFARQIQLHHRWTPGAWCNPAMLDCTVYYAHFGRFLLNEHYAILPGVEAIRQADWLFDAFARDGRLFVRPTACDKLFVGRAVSRDDFASILSPARYDPGTLVVVAPARPIAREWRLIVLEGHVLGGSQYAENGQRSVRAELPAELRAFAERMFTDVRWRPDPVFMLDICESAGVLRLVELNGFSTSWLYACDLTTVIAELSDFAVREWERSSP
ncbi:MAG TPA: ATP-grasp domain-containing protein [Tepidisphaeraceae bacterium]|jgi:hypothetical protein